MGLFGRLMGGKRKQGGASVAEENERADHVPAMDLKRVEVPVPPKMTKQEMIEELERNYREVLDLVRRVKDHMDREEERSGRVMEVAERIDSAVPAVEGLADRIDAAHERSSDSLVEAIRISEQDRFAMAERVEGTLRDLAARMEEGGITHERIASELDGLGERVGELTQSSVAASKALQTIRDGATDRDTKFVTSIETARKSIVQAIWIGAAIVGVGLIIAAIIFVSRGGSPAG